MPDTKNPPISDNKTPGPISPSPTGSGSINQPVQPAGFEADTKSDTTHSTAKPPIPADAIPPVKKEEPLTGMANKIDEAKKFNSKLSHLTDKELAEEMHNRHVLQNAIGDADALEKERAIGFPSKVDRSSRILEVLRNKGMDSQQAQQALVTINDILYEETIVETVEGKEKKDNANRPDKTK